VRHIRSKRAKGIFSFELTLGMANLVGRKGTLDRPLCRNVSHYLDFAARYPACLASCSVMNFPCLVAPYHWPLL
jgi:hypothetical protein